MLPGAVHVRVVGHPEIVGDDEQTVAQANAGLEGLNRATALLGPSAAGVLIGVIGATNVLYVDAASFLLSFLVLAAFVPKRPPLPATEESRGLLAGVRYLLRDPFLRTLGITALFLNMFGQMEVASLLVLADVHFGESARVAGAFFASFGGGAVVGSLLAVKLVKRFDPIRLAAVALVALTAPVPLLALDLPVAAVMAVLFASSIFGPLVNAPLIAVITTRTPEALRAKVMSAVITSALLAGPLGLLIVGPLLSDLGPRPALLLIAIGQFLATLPFAFIALRRPRGGSEAPSQPTPQES